MEWITILGLTAAALTGFAAFPQFLKARKQCHTKDVSLSMYIIMVVGMAIWIIYGFLDMDIPVIVSSIFSLTINGAVLITKIYCDAKRRRAQKNR